LYAPEFGLDYFLACNVNNRENVRFGAVTPASADGRKAWTPLANGNTPTSGNDRQGVTAVLVSMAKAENKANAGFTHNIKFSKALFREERPKVEALLDTYFSMGGASVMITCVGRDELEKAQRNPEQYKNLMVRVGGFSARFVELEPELREDILKRTLY
jgi:pyruvate-formate lyase